MASLVWGHHAIIGRHYQHRDIGHHRAARPHRGEGRVAGRVQESDLAILAFNLVRADMLGNATGLAIYHPRLTNRVQQRGLAMIYMPQHRHHRWSKNQLVRIFSRHDLLAQCLRRLCGGFSDFRFRLGLTLNGDAEIPRLRFAQYRNQSSA